MATPNNNELKDLLKQIQDLQKAWSEATDASVKTHKFEEMKDILEAANIHADKMKNSSIAISEENAKSLKTLNATSINMGKMLLINKGIVSTFKEMGKETAKFSHDVGEWFKKSEELANEYLTVSKNIGLSSRNTTVLTDNFNNAVRESMRLGYSLEDMKETFGTFAEETGRARILSDDEAENIAKISQGASLYASEATKMAEAFDLMGVSSQHIVDHLNETINMSSEMGLNANKVIKVLSDNMRTMQQYSFVNGVKGMTSMAAQAVKMRVDVSEVLQMADKFYQPEAAIEAAANLQMLGGDIAKAFGDPFETMYLARNKPEELANRVAKMTENMMQFNEKTGEFEMPAEVRMQLQAVSKELGMSEGSMMEMARQASKIKTIKMDVAGDIKDEKVRESIAGLARMKDGHWKVDYTDLNGVKQTTAIEDLTNEQAKAILQRKEEKEGKSSEDWLAEIAINTQTFTERMKNIQESQQYGFVGEADVYTATMEGFLKQTMNNTEIRMSKLFESINDGVGSWADGANSGMKEVMRQAFGVKPGVKPEEQESILSEMIGSVFQKLTAASDNAYVNGKWSVEKMTTEATNVFITTGGATPVGDVRINAGNRNMIIGSEGQLIQGTANDSTLMAPGAAEGLSTAGVTSYIPTKTTMSFEPITGRIELVSPTGEIGEIDMSKIQPLIVNAINEASRKGGTLSSKETVDRGIGT